MRTNRILILFLLSAFFSFLAGKNVPFAKLKAYPNPFDNQSENLTIVKLINNTDTAFTGSVRLYVYDFNLKLVHEDVQSGTVYWNGHDKLGRRLPPGLYFIKVVEINQTDKNTLSSEFIKVIIK